MTTKTDGNKAYAYYPGCSQSGTAVEYEMSARAVCEALGIELREIDDWSCCGASPAHERGADLQAALAARNLELARGMGLNRLATPCPSCLSALKTAEAYAGKSEGRELLGRLCDMEIGDGLPAYSLLQVILEEAGADAVRRAAVRPLAGLTAATYYGCLLSRPSGLMEFEEPENPVSMDRLLRAAGADVIDFALKVECCGAGMGVPKREVVRRLSGRILDMAVRQGADVLVTACPLCHQNLDLRQAQLTRAGNSQPLPVVYFTQMLGLAMGLSPESLGLNLHAVDTGGLLNRIAAPQNES